MIRLSLILASGCAFILAGCAPSAPPPIVDVASIPATDPLYRPERVRPGELEYAPDRTTFAPVLTERFPYPTQVQANDAYRRLLAEAPSDSPTPSSVRVFGCKPGVLDEQTARVTRYRGPLVHCAVDFLDAAGRPVARETANFDYWRSAWRMQPVHPPRALVPWRNPERLSQDIWRWAPGRDRYE
jgi:hypothetical protein